MNRQRKQKIRDIQSDDELSESGPEISDAEDYAEESDDQNVMEVGIEGRDDSEDDYDDEEFDENDEFESAHPAIPSADAFGKDDFYEKGTEKTTRKMKRDERNEIRKLEELDAKERRQQLHSLLETDLPQSESDSDDEDEDEKNEKEDLGDKNDDEKIKLLKRQSPEFFPLLQELRIYKSELDDTLKPLKKILGEKDDPRFVAYINRRLEVVQAYCANILFYIRLRAKASQALQDHPVIGRLAQFKSILNKITSEKTQDYAKVYLEIYEDLRLQRKEVDEEQSDAEEENEDHLADFEALTEGKKSRTKNEDDEGEESEYDEDGKRKRLYSQAPEKETKSACQTPGGLFGCIETKKGSCPRSTKRNDKILRRGIRNQSWSQKVCSDQKLKIKYSRAD